MSISVLMGVHTVTVVCCSQNFWEHVTLDSLLLWGVFCGLAVLNLTADRIFWKLLQSSVSVPQGSQ